MLRPTTSTASLSTPSPPGPGPAARADLLDRRRGRAASDGVRFPVCIIDDFLGSDACARLHAFAVDNEAAFAPSRVHTREQRQVIQTGLRDSFTFSGSFGPQMAPFHARLDESYDRIAARLGTGLFERNPTELHMVAHRDGQYLGRHIDTQTSPTPSAPVNNRVMTLIYYFNREPRAFTGGDLVIYPMIGDAHEVIAPRADRLVAIPSFAPHEILPVEVPGNRFADARVALVSWLVRPPAAASPAGAA